MAIINIQTTWEKIQPLFDGYLPIGFPVGERFQIIRLVASGGMGDIYEARQNGFPDSPVVIKVMQLWLASYSNVCNLWHREAEITRQLGQHLNIVGIIDYGCIEIDNVKIPYIVMSGLFGGTLESRLLNTFAQKLSIVERLNAYANDLMQLLHVIEFAHFRNIIHADIKPQNIIYGDDGYPRLGDWGLAVRIGTDQPVSGRTPMYSAPEQDKHPVQISLATDVCLLGLIIADIIIGSVPPAIISKCNQCIDYIDWRRQRLGAILNHFYIDRCLCDCIKTIICCLDEKEASRPSIKEIRAALQSWRNANDDRAHRQLISWAHFTGTTILLLIILFLVAEFRRSVYDSERTFYSDSIDNHTQNLDIFIHDDISINRDLAILKRRDSDLELLKRASYIDKLIYLCSKSNSYLGKLERELLAIQSEGFSYHQRFRTHERWLVFLPLTNPHSHSAKFDFFVRPDPDRTRRLNQLLSICKLLVPSNQPLPPALVARVLRNYLAMGEPELAWECGFDYISTNQIEPAWLILILRDLIWLSVSYDNRNYASQLLDLLEKQSGSNESLNEIDIEKATLHRYFETIRLEDAKKDLVQYFNRQDNDVHLNDQHTENKRLPTGPIDVNVPALISLDAILLEGFISEQLNPHVPYPWLQKFQDIKLTNSIQFYETAIIGSLGNGINESDARRMIASTFANSYIKSPVLLQLRQAANNTSNSLLLDVAKVALNNAWQSKRGRNYAQQIAFRQLGFDQFCTIQFRLWLHETLRYFMRPNGVWADDEDEIVWQLVNLMFVKYLGSGLTNSKERTIVEHLDEHLLTDLVEFIQDKRRCISLTEWESVANRFIPEVRPYFAYVIGRIIQTNANPIISGFIAQKYYKYALDHISDIPVHCRTSFSHFIKKQFGK